MAITTLTGQVFVNDIGTVFRATIKEDDVVVPVDSATTQQFIFQPPDGVSFTRITVFTTDGTDGKIEYVTVNGDLSVGGQWKIQAYLVLSAWTGHSEIVQFKVYDKLT